MSSYHLDSMFAIRKTYSTMRSTTLAPQSLQNEFRFLVELGRNYGKRLQDFMKAVVSELRVRTGVDLGRRARIGIRIRIRIGVRVRVILFVDRASTKARDKRQDKFLW